MKTRSSIINSRSLHLSVLGVLLAIVTSANGGKNNYGMSSALGQTNRTPQCPPINEISPCSCRVMSKGLDVVCDKTDEKHVMNALNVLKQNSFAIYWMKFRNSKLPRIKDYIFLSLDIRHLNIIRSNVSVVERASLSALGGSLTDLDLSNNNIQSIPTAAFSHMKSLNFLNMNYNKITNIKESAFEGLVMLERLSLYENKIKRIHPNAFQGIGRKLSRLNLGKNELSSIPTDTFHPLLDLMVLDLNENYITQLPNKAFEGLHKLDILKLEHNQIEKIQDNVFADLKILNSLNLEHNKIKNITDHAFSGLEDHLGWLEIGHNQLDHIPSHALRPLHNLRQLDLDSNQISVMPEDAFRGYGETLKFLLLDKNHIKEIPPLTFIDLHSMEWLKLSHNELKTLTEDTVQPILDTLKHIDVSNNPLECNCDIYWLYLWMKDPRHSDAVEAAEDHRCRHEKSGLHMMKQLSDDAFDCPNSRFAEMQNSRKQASGQVRTSYEPIVCLVSLAFYFFV